MADLVLDWGLLGAYGTGLDGNGTTTTVDTGGVNVGISFTAQDADAQAFTYDADVYVGAGEPFDPNSHLKLFGDGGDTTGASATSTTVLQFSSADTETYGNSVQNVSFRLSDIDRAAGSDLFDGDPAGEHQDIVTVLAYDAEGNEVPVSITPAAANSLSGQTLTGESATAFTDAAGSALVNIEGPVARIEIIYQNNGDAEQSALVSDIAFSTVDPEDQDPDAADDAATTIVGTPVTIDVLANDTDPNGDPLNVVSTGTTPNGTVALNADGTLEYTPNPGFTGTDSFEYTVSDDDGNLDTATVTVTVNPAPNGTPVAVDDTATVPAGETVVVDVLANDSDPDGDPLSVDSIGTPANGTATLNPDGTISYTPDPGFTGEDTISYVVDDGEGGHDTGSLVVTVTPMRDGIVEGTPGDDLIDDAYLGDPDTPPDQIDNGDAIIPGEAPDDDIVRAGDGDDTVYAGEGSDDVEGGSGNDLIDTGAADPRIDRDIFPVDAALQPLDPLNGADEDPDPSNDLDSVLGGDGNDTILTGDDADTIRGGAGDDSIQPGIDDDLVEGNLGNDTIFDLQGSDTIDGGAGDDSIIAGTDTFSDYVGDDPNLPILGFASDPNTEDGRDLVFGGIGNDHVETGDDRDTIDGGAGNDTLLGGIDDDLIDGATGDDSILGGHGSDTLNGGQDNDYIDGSNPAALELTDDVDPVPENDRDLISGNTGDDTLIGGDDDDTLLGGSGNDSLDGGIDEDSLVGGSGNDTLLGGQGGDTLDGGAGTDSIDGGADRDTIVVGSATDGAGDTVQGGNAGDDHDVLDLTGVGAGNFRLTNVRADDDGPGVTPNGIDGTVEFLNGAGAVTGTMDFFNIEEVVPCFTPGTVIATPMGERLVEDLREGDRVITRDNGIQEIRWIGRKDLTGHMLARKPHMRPILIQAGSLGNGLPEHDLLVSPNHRVLVNNDKTALYFEEREVLAAAKHLTGLEGVDEVGTLGVSYIHFMFDRHEVVLSNGAWTESFQPGDYTLDGIGNAQRNEIFELFPELQTADGVQAYQSARRSLKKHEARLIVK